MRLRLLVGIAGDTFSHKPGDEIEAEGEDARRLLKAGYAQALPAMIAATATATGAGGGSPGGEVDKPAGRRAASPSPAPKPPAKGKGRKG